MRDGAPAWFAGRGTVDGAAPAGDTQYRIGSLTKMFVVVAVLRLRDEGALRLTHPLGQHLPTAAPSELRIGELLAHTGGLAADSAGPWWERTPGDLRPGSPTCSARTTAGGTRPAGGFTIPTSVSHSWAPWSPGSGAGRGTR
jgi:CubicO group peptidase (beta-lactamase class C family)